MSKTFNFFDIWSLTIHYPVLTPYEWFLFWFNFIGLIGLFLILIGFILFFFNLVIKALRSETE